MTGSSSFLADAQIAVVGAGAVGSVIAYRLAQAGASVTIVDQKFAGGGTTGNSFAWINSFGKTPREYHRLSVRSIREHRDLAQELNGNWVHVDGGLAWEWSTDSGRSARLRETVRQLHRWGYRIETLSPEQVMLELEPDLFIDPDVVDVVYHTPDEGWLSGVGLCHGAIRAAMLRYDATFIRDEVIGFEHSQGNVEAIKLANGGDLAVDAVVNAAGAHAGEIANHAGVELPITRQPGFLVVSEPAPVHFRTVVRSPEIKFRHDGGWRLLLQGEDFDSHFREDGSIETADELAQLAIDRVSKLSPRSTGIRPEAFRYGVRPMPNDGLPIIGFDPNVGGLYHAVMHSGVTLSAVVGSLVAEDFLGMEPQELEPYRIERFSSDVPLPVHSTIE